MVNYGNSKVYKIWSSLGDKIYIGSTTKDYLSRRMVHHRFCYKKWKEDETNRDIYTTSFIIFDEYGLENCKIELIEAKVCQTKDELKQLEGKYIRELECVNTCIPNRTVKEYKKQYYQEHKEQAKLYLEKNKERLQNYYQINKEKIKENRRLRYEKNKK